MLQGEIVSIEPMHACYIQDCSAEHPDTTCIRYTRLGRPDAYHLVIMPQDKAQILVPVLISPATYDYLVLTRGELIGKDITFDEERSTLVVSDPEECPFLPEDVAQEDERL